MRRRRSLTAEATGNVTEWTQRVAGTALPLEDAADLDSLRERSQTDDLFRSQGGRPVSGQ